MRLSIQDDANEFSPQTRAYAEYRAFSGLVGNDADMAEVTISLTGAARDKGEREDGRVVCTISVRMKSGRIEQARAVADHAYAAIDRAVSLIQTSSMTASAPGRS